MWYGIFTMHKPYCVIFRADKEDNWIHDYWLNLAYLSSRKPLPGTRCNHAPSQLVVTTDCLLVWVLSNYQQKFRKPVDGCHRHALVNDWNFSCDINSIKLFIDVWNIQLNLLWRFTECFQCTIIISWEMRMSAKAFSSWRALPLWRITWSSKHVTSIVSLHLLLSLCSLSPASVSVFWDSGNTRLSLSFRQRSLFLMLMLVVTTENRKSASLVIIIGVRRGGGMVIMFNPTVECGRGLFERPLVTL